MLPIATFLLCCGYVLWRSAQNPSHGSLAYLFLVLVSPTLPFGSGGIRLEHLLPGLLLAVLVARDGWRSLQLCTPTVLFAAWTGVALLSTLLYDGQVGLLPVGAVRLYTIVRPLLLLILFSSVVRTWTFERPFHLEALTGFGIAALPLGVLALGQTLGIGFATELTLGWYTSPGRIAVATLIAKTGVILRAVSVFETPAYAATYFLLAIGSSAIVLNDPATTIQRRNLLRVAVIIALLGGLSTLSATFVAGLPIVGATLYLTAPTRTRATIRSSILVAGITATMLGVALATNERIGVSLRYQIERVANLTLLASRYSASGGQVSDALISIAAHPLGGTGIASPAHLFIGDSLYVSILYSSGIIGLLFYAGIAVWFALQAGRTPTTNRQAAFLWLAVIAASGFGSPATSIVRIQDWIWAFVGWTAALPTYDIASVTTNSEARDDRAISS